MRIFSQRNRGKKKRKKEREPEKEGGSSSLKIPRSLFFMIEKAVKKEKNKNRVRLIPLRLKMTKIVSIVKVLITCHKMMVFLRGNIIMSKSTGRESFDMINI